MEANVHIHTTYIHTYTNIHTYIYTYSVDAARGVQMRRRESNEHARRLWNVRVEYPFY